MSINGAEVRKDDDEGHYAKTQAEKSSAAINKGERMICNSKNTKIYSILQDRKISIGKVLIPLLAPIIMFGNALDDANALYNMQSIEKAARLYRNACKQGYAEGCAKLTQIYQKCMLVSFNVVQKLSNNTYGITLHNRPNKLLMLHTLYTEYTSGGLAHMLVSKKVDTTSITLQSGFSSATLSYTECSIYDVSLKMDVAYKDKVCNYLTPGSTIGVIEGYITSNIDKYSFILENKYYITTNYAYFGENNKNKLKIIVRKTGSRDVSFLELYPYKYKPGESEYSSQAVMHKRRYPGNKFKVLPSVYLLDYFDNQCK